MAPSRVPGFSCLESASEAQWVNLDGAISPALLSFGSGFGVGHILMESSTNDSAVFDLVSAVPTVLGGAGAVISAVDGL
jgi:hypothetical protein